MDIMLWKSFKWIVPHNEYLKKKKNDLGMVQLYKLNLYLVLR